MNLKKFLCLFLLITVVFSLASCGKKFTVTFNSDGGTAVSSQTVKKGMMAVDPGDPTKDGYTFLGWYNGDTKWDFTTAVTGNLTLTARWEKIVEEEPTPDPKPDPKPTVCDHVDENDDGKCDKCSALIETYTITYYDGVKKLKLSPDSFSMKDNNFELPTPPAKANYEFVGWYTDKDLTNLATYINTSAKENLSFYAKYVPVVYTITYNLDGGENAAKNPDTYTVKDVKITLAEPTKDGYSFRGWYTDNVFTQPITEITKSNIGNLVLYARWAKLADKYTITYLDHNGNELAVDEYFKSDSDQPIRSSLDFEILNVPGYSFISWVDADDESIVYNCIPAGMDRNFTVKATLKNEATHNILYYVDGGFDFRGTFLEIEGLDNLYIPVKGGYSFDGWYSSITCSGAKVTSIPANTMEDIKLYGKFIPNEYNVSFTVDGVTVDLGLSKYTTSDAGTALPAIPEKSGYHILGWFTTEGVLMEENKIAGGQYGDLELVAVYEKNTYKITYHLNGGSNDPANVTEYRFEEIPTLKDPSKSGYKFAGWYDNANFSGVPIDNLADEKYANKDISIFALWIPDIENDNSTLTPEVPF